MSSREAYWARGLEDRPALAEMIPIRAVGVACLRACLSVKKCAVILFGRQC